ncbi:MAG: amidohydrolase family protein, partial [Pseudomonadota bacterium]
MRPVLLAAVATFCVAGAAAQDDVAETLIHAGHVLAVPGDGYLTEQTITVVDGSIASLEAGFVDPGEGDTVIDLK